MSPRTSSASPDVGVRTRADGRVVRWDGQRAARRAEFVQAAVRVVDREGADASVHAIVADAGVTKPVLYRHFRDKDDLLRAVGMWGARLLIDRLEGALSQDAELIELVRSGVDVYVATVAEHPGVFRLVLSHRIDARGGDDPLETGKTVIAGQVADLARLLLGPTDLDDDAAEPLAAGVVGLALGMTEWWLEHPEVDRETVASQLSTVLILAIEGLMSSTSSGDGSGAALFSPVRRSAPEDDAR